jgi:hypothetical protein
LIAAVWAGGLMDGYLASSMRDQFVIGSIVN